MQIVARFFDGKSATEHSVTLTFTAGTLALRGHGLERYASIDDVEVVAPVGSGDWCIQFADGASARFRDQAFAAALTEGRPTDWAARLEQSWPWALALLLFTVVGTWGLLNYGLPAAARTVAFSLPVELDRSLSNDSLSVLDEFLFEESSLEAAERAHVQALFDRIVADEPAFAHYELHFRSSETMGPNALALPGGNVVMLDSLVRLAADDAELSAVLAHEVGHQAQRHILRMVLQDSVAAVLVATLTGDLTSVSALAASIPTVMMQSKYSRDFEREADDFAFAYLEENDMDTAALSRLLLRLEEESGASDHDGPASWLASHPRSEERVPAR